MRISIYYESSDVSLLTQTGTPCIVRTYSKHAHSIHLRGQFSAPPAVRPFQGTRVPSRRGCASAAPWFCLWFCRKPISRWWKIFWLTFRFRRSHSQIARWNWRFFGVFLDRLLCIEELVVRSSYDLLWNSRKVKKKMKYRGAEISFSDGRSILLLFCFFNSFLYLYFFFVKRKNRAAHSFLMRSFSTVQLTRGYNLFMKIDYYIYSIYYIPTFILNTCFAENKK